MFKIISALLFLAASILFVIVGFMHIGQDNTAFVLACFSFSIAANAHFRLNMEDIKKSGRRGKK